MANGSSTSAERPFPFCAYERLRPAPLPRAGPALILISCMVGTCHRPQLHTQANTAQRALTIAGDPRLRKRVMAR
eukprot:6173130-Amphidinium_carterae.1